MCDETENCSAAHHSATEAFSFLTSLLACLKDELVVTGLGGTLQSGIDVPRLRRGVGDNLFGKHEVGNGGAAPQTPTYCDQQGSGLENEV